MQPTPLEDNGIDIALVLTSKTSEGRAEVQSSKAETARLKKGCCSWFDRLTMSFNS